MMYTLRSKPSWMPLFASILCLSPLASWSEKPVGVAHPASISEGTSNAEDAQLQAQLASLREKYQQDRQALKARSAQLPPEERMRLHKALLDSHQVAMTRLEQNEKNHSANSKARWEERRNQRSERLEEVRKDGSAHKRRHDQ